MLGEILLFVTILFLINTLYNIHEGWYYILQEKICFNMTLESIYIVFLRKEKLIIINNEKYMYTYKA